MDDMTAFEIGFHAGWEDITYNHTEHGIPEEFRSAYYDGYAEGYKAAKNGEYAEYDDDE